jgi:hypothetical protein
LIFSTLIAYYLILKEKEKKMKYILSFILGVVISCIVLKMGWFSTLSIDNKIEIVKGSLSGLYIAIGGIISLLVYRGTKKKEISFKLHEEKRSLYNEFSGMFFEMMDSYKIAKKNPKLMDKKMEELDEKQRKILRKMVCFSSTELLKKSIDYYRIARNMTKERNFDLIVILGDILFIIRKELNFGKDEGMTKRDILSLFINDIYDSKYDDDFREKKLLKHQINK